MLAVIDIASHMVGRRSYLAQAVQCGDTRVKTGQPRIFNMCEPSIYLVYVRLEIVLFMKKTHIFKLASIITPPLSNSGCPRPFEEMTKAIGDER